MKQAKRILSMLLSLCLVLGMIPGTVFAAASNPFTDVDAAEWYADAVQYVYEKGIMVGSSDTTFSPKVVTTRGMVVTLLHNLEGKPAAEGTTFTDVPVGQWYADAVSWASANEIVSGYGNGLFGPDDIITREQMVTILNHYSTYKGYETATAVSIESYADAAQVSSFAVEPMGWAIANKLVSGTGNNMLSPKGNATRAEIAAIMMHFCENIAAAAKAVEKYTVTFDLNYGSDSKYDSKTVEAGNTVSKPSNPTRTGYTFDGWYTEKTGGKQFDFKTGIVSDLTLYAHWTSNSSTGNSSDSGSYTPPSVTYYTVTFYMNDGTNTVYTTVTSELGDRIAAPASPNRAGYVFDGWYTDKDSGVRFDFATGIVTDLALYAHWSIVGSSGVLTPDIDDDDEDIPEEDRDSDGVPNWLEDYLNISDGSNDSDGDGIDDYTELYVVGSDPASFDSDQDKDGDGISNLDEVKTYKTNPIKKDTDLDGLTDYEEINRYQTDPLKNDTDGDGIIDGDEIRLGMNPTVADADQLSGIQQNLGASQIDDGLLEDNEAIPSITGTSNQVLDRSVSISESSHISLDDNRAVVGKGIDLSIEGNANLQLTFTMPASCDSMVVMVMDEEEGWIPVESLARGDNTITVPVTQSGTYCVMDLEVLLPLLGIDLSAIYDEIMGGGSSSEGEGGSSYTLSRDTSITLSQSNHPTLRTLAVDGSERKPLALTEASGPSVMGQADIVFVLDTTGSMEDEIDNVANNVVEFARALTKEYNVNANFALLEYRDIVVDGYGSTSIIKNGRSNWYTDVNVFRYAVERLTVNGGGDTPETAVDALEAARNLDFRSTAKKFIILITDADYKNDNNYGISSMEEEISLLVQGGIITSVVTDSLYKDTYQNLYTNTGGIYADIYGDFSDELLRLAGLIGDEVGEGSWILLDDYQYVALMNPLSPTSGDTDGDGLSDYEELKAPKAKDLTLLVEFLLALHNVPQELIDEYFALSDERGIYITVYPYNSNPALIDTDYDGRNDNEDAVPKGNHFSGTLKAKANNSVSFYMDYRWFFEDNTVYNPALSTTSILFSSAIYATNSLSITDSKGKNSTSGEEITDVLSFFGFSKPEAKKLTKEVYKDNHLSEVGLGYRTVTYKGTTKNIVAVVVRGTNGSTEEWSSNFDIGDPRKYTGRDDWKEFNNHAGFDIAANRIMKIIDSYIDQYKLNGSNTVFWITGHSRGAAIANIIGAYYERAGKTAYTYTFATPNTTLAKDWRSYQSIFNVVNSDDFVAYLPTSQWGYARYGRTASISLAANYEDEWESLTRKWDYNPDTYGLLDTVDEIAKILDTRDGDIRLQCYTYTCSCHGDGTSDNITIINRGTTESSREKAIKKIPKNAEPYCIITRYDGGWLGGWDFTVCQTPAYFMQILAAKQAGDLSIPQFVLLNVADRYEDAKLALVGSGNPVTGGLEHPHWTESYYILAEHVGESLFE